MPVKLAKRGGFDDKVQLTFPGCSKNVKATNVAIEKGSDTALARLDFPMANAAVEGTYTLYLQAGQSEVLEEPCSDWSEDHCSSETADKALKAAQETAKKAAEAAATAQNELTAATKALTDAQAKVKADQANLTKAQAAEKVAADAKTKADGSQ